MRFAPFFAVFTLVFIIFSGCSTQSVITESDNPGVVMEKVRARNAAIRTLKGNGKISMDSPEFSGSGNIELRLSKPDTVLLRITGPFGISVANGLITSETFTLYDGTQNLVVEGETTATNLRRAFRMTIEFDDILSILSGSFGVAGGRSGTIPKGTFADGTYNLLFSIPEGTEEYRIDPDYAAVTRYIRKSQSGEVVQDLSFRDFRKHDGYYIPHVVTYTRPGFDESLSIVYDRISVNELPLDFAFSVPSGAKRKQL